MQTCHCCFTVSYSDFLIDTRYSLSADVESYAWYPNKNVQTYEHNNEFWQQVRFDNKCAQPKKKNSLACISLHTTRYKPLSANCAQFPHKIFSFLKPLNPWFALQNLRKWPTANTIETLWEIKHYPCLCWGECSQKNQNEIHSNSKSPQLRINDSKTWLN